MRDMDIVGVDVDVVDVAVEDHTRHNVHLTHYPRPGRPERAEDTEQRT